MSKSTKAHVLSERQTQSLADQFVLQLAEYDNRPLVVYLLGDLGVGKSVFARSILRALGVSCSIKSPTYTLVEQYSLENSEHNSRRSPEQVSVNGFSLAAHLDLYRLVDPEELYFIGFDEIASNCDLLLVEWPDKGVGFLPNATHTILIDYPLNVQSSQDHSDARDIVIIEH